MRNPFAVAARRQGGPMASFDGASSSRLFADWPAVATAPDRELVWAARELRSRARDLVRNNSYAEGIVKAFADNIVGAKGIWLKPRIRDGERRPVREVNRELERGWLDWSLNENASADGHDSWPDLQYLIARNWAQDGEVFIRTHRGFSNPHDFALQLIDPDLLDESYNRPPDDNGNEIRMGVEVDRFQRPVAYHFWPRHPSDLHRNARHQRVRIPATEIVHHFVRYRPGQTRGYTLFAPALTSMKMMDGFQEAELVASRLAAAKMGWITNNTDEAIAAYAERLRIQNDLLAESDDPDAQAQPRPMDIAPGLVEELQPGQDFTSFDPNHPNDAFADFMKVILRGVSRSFGMSYLTLTGDVSEANYSSMRAGLLPERDHWRIQQATLYRRVHRRVYRTWIPNAMRAGAVSLPTAAPSDYFEHAWKPRGWKWVDPLKDLLALEIGILLGVDSRTNGAAEQGRDFEAVIDELRDELEYADEEDVYVGGSKAPAGLPALEDSAGNSNGNGARNGRASMIRRFLTLMEGEEHGRH